VSTPNIRPGLPGRTIAPGSALAISLLLAPCLVLAQGQTCAAQGPPQNGKGVKIDARCNRSEGTFRNGQLTGPGKITFGDGRVAEGEFHEDRLYGTATLTWPDGRRFEGMTHANRTSGPGKYIDAGGSEYEGTFTTGAKLIGFGTRKSPDGSVLVGEFRDGEPFGNMMLVKADGTREQVAYPYPTTRRPPVAAVSDKPAASPTTAPPSQPPGNPKELLDDVNKTIRTLRGIFGR
jgi:hypothetical protein